MDAKLELTLSEVTFDSLPLDKALALLADQSHANLVTDWNDLETAGVKRGTVIDLRLRGVSLRTALRVVLDMASPAIRLGFRESVPDHVILIATAKKLANRPIVKMYDVRDVVERGRDYILYHLPPSTRPADEPPTNAEVGVQLQDVIESNIDSDQWVENGGTFRISEFAGRFVIVADEETHAKVEALLRAIRASDKVPAPATRPVLIGR